MEELHATLADDSPTGSLSEDSDFEEQGEINDEQSAFLPDVITRELGEIDVEKSINHGFSNKGVQKEEPSPAKSATRIENMADLNISDTRSEEETTSIPIESSVMVGLTHNLHDLSERQTKGRISLDDLGELDFDESSDEGEMSDEKDDQTNEPPVKMEKKREERAGSEEGEVCAESEDDDYEEGELKSSDEDTSSPDEDMLREMDPQTSYPGGPGGVMEERPVCRFFQRGMCHFGLNCRFIHPEINEGPVGLQAPGPPVAWAGEEESAPAEEEPPAKPPAPVTESAWERGLRHAKKMRELAKQRREEEQDFEEKRLHLKPAPLPDEPSSPVQKEDKRSEKKKSDEPLYEDASEDEYYDKSAIDPWKHDLFEPEPRQPPAQWSQYPEEPAPYPNDYDSRYANNRGMNAPRAAQVEDEFWDKARGGPADMGRGRRGDQWLDPWQRAKPMQQRSLSQERKKRGRHSQSRSSSSYSSRSGSSSSSSSYSSRSSSSSSSRSSSSRSARNSRSRVPREAMKPKRNKAVDSKKPPAPGAAKKTDEKAKVSSPVKSSVSKPAASGTGKPTEASAAAERAARKKDGPAAQDKNYKTNAQGKPTPSGKGAKSAASSKKKPPKDKAPANYRRHRRHSSSSSASSRSGSGHSSSSSRSSRSSSSHSSRSTSRSSSGSADSDHLYRNIRHMPNKQDGRRGKEGEETRSGRPEKAVARTPASPPQHKKAEPVRALPKTSRLPTDPKVIPLDTNVRGMYSQVGMMDKDKSGRDQTGRDPGKARNHGGSREQREINRSERSRDAEKQSLREGKTGKDRDGQVDKNKENIRSDRSQREGGRGRGYQQDQGRNYWESGRDQGREVGRDQGRDMGRSQGREHREQHRTKQQQEEPQRTQHREDPQRAQHRDERSRKEEQHGGWQSRSSETYKDRRMDNANHVVSQVTKESKDPFKAGGQKQGIKLTLKDKQSELDKGSKRPAPTSAAASPAKKAKTTDSTASVEEKRTITMGKPAATKPAVPPAKQPATAVVGATTAKPAAAKPAPKKKTVSSRREELLQQLKAVEDAIQRKKKKLN